LIFSPVAACAVRVGWWDMRVLSSVSILAGGAILCGCSFIPPVPDDYSLPVREILQHTACELQDAFVILSAKEFSSFNASKWLVAVKLTPKTDSEINAGLGVTGKSTTLSGAKYFNNWAFGSVGSPGADVDVKGTRIATITFKLTSKDLLHPKEKLICPVDSPRLHALAENLGISDWLVRLVRAKNQAVGSLAKFDTPTYSSQIVVKFTGNGNFTYTFPFGTNFAALSGNYDMDETLEITLSPATGGGGPISVQTLPQGGVFKDGPDKVTVSSQVNAEQKLDNTVNQQGIINAIRNLPH
jgi:hypothetical protein